MANSQSVGSLRMNMSSSSEYPILWMPLSHRASVLCSYISTGQGESFWSWSSQPSALVERISVSSSIFVPLAGASTFLVAPEFAFPLGRKRFMREWAHAINIPKAVDKATPPSCGRFTMSPDASRYVEGNVEAAEIPWSVGPEINRFSSPAELDRIGFFSSVIESPSLNPKSLHDRARIPSMYWSSRVQAGTWGTSTGKGVMNESNARVKKLLRSPTVREIVHPVKMESRRIVRMMNVLVLKEIWRCK